jgi:hypothetical protein
VQLLNTLKSKFKFIQTSFRLYIIMRLNPFIIEFIQAWIYSLSLSIVMTSWERVPTEQIHGNKNLTYKLGNLPSFFFTCQLPGPLFPLLPIFNFQNFGFKIETIKIYAWIIIFCFILSTLMKLNFKEIKFQTGRYLILA